MPRLQATHSHTLRPAAEKPAPPSHPQLRLRAKHEGRCDLGEEIGFWLQRVALSEPVETGAALTKQSLQSVFCSQVRRRPIFPKRLRGRAGGETAANREDELEFTA